VSKEGEIVHGWWNDGELSVQLDSLHMDGVAKPATMSYADKVDLGSDDELSTQKQPQQMQPPMMQAAGGGLD
jgi:hypothetical protein